MSIQDIQAIDVHAHYGRMVRGGDPRFDDWVSGDASLVAERARNANTEWTIVSPLEALMPRGEADAYQGNEAAATEVAATDGLLQWVVLNPLQESTYEQTERMLRLPRCVGIKLHPEEHCYPIEAHGRKLFEFAARHRAIVLTHSGQVNSWPEAFVPFLNDFPEVRLIVAHIGCSDDVDRTHQVRAIQMSKHGNIYADTSSAQSILSGIIEFAVREAGPEHILYGTDTPLYSAAAQRARIDQAEISDRDKRLILRENSLKIFGL